MKRFDSFLMVDWSGGADRGPHPKADAIWAALARPGGAEPPRYFRNRALAEAWLAELLVAERTAGRRVLAGFDFPFGYPRGFARNLIGRADPLALWDWFAARLGADTGDRFALAAEINARFPGLGPFWFNGGKVDLPDLPRKGRARHGHGLPERRLAERHAKGSFTLWQMGGAGAVGSQAMTGMAALSRLRARFPGEISVWPFEVLDRPIALVEIWPSLYAREIAAARPRGEIRDRAQVRVMAARLKRMQDEGRLAQGLAAREAARAEEGWIFGLGLPAETPREVPAC